MRFAGLEDNEGEERNERLLSPRISSFLFPNEDFGLLVLSRNGSGHWSELNALSERAQLFLIHFIVHNAVVDKRASERTYNAYVWRRLFLPDLHCPILIDLRILIGTYWDFSARDHKDFEHLKVHKNNLHYVFSDWATNTFYMYTRHLRDFSNIKFGFKASTVDAFRLFFLELFCFGGIVLFLSLSLFW